MSQPNRDVLFEGKSCQIEMIRDSSSIDIVFRDGMTQPVSIPKNELFKFFEEVLRAEAMEGLRGASLKDLFKVHGTF